MLAALAAARPAAVLIEGPPEGDALLPLAAIAMRPPVALLAHAVDDPGRASFWPMAAFSPEWVALRGPSTTASRSASSTCPPRTRSRSRPPRPGRGRPPAPRRGSRRERAEDDEVTPAVDPIRVLAETAGYDDPERWWEDVVEHRSPGGGTGTGGTTGTGQRHRTGDGSGCDRGSRRGTVGPARATKTTRGAALAPFAALAEAMGALREAYGDGDRPRDAVREAYMRIQLRTVRKEFGDAVAVVCGAWTCPPSPRGPPSPPTAPCSRGSRRSRRS
ncbi:hypothetical protein SCALM49S_06118 [Streptomyces californicus]